MSRDIYAIERRIAAIEEHIARTLEERLGRMATRDDLDTAIVSIQTTAQSVGQQVQQVLDALQAKAGAVDFQPEIDRLNQINAQLQAIGTEQPTPPAASTPDAPASEPTTPAQ